MTTRLPTTALLLLLAGATAQDCDLQCFQGAPCVAGSPDFSTHPVNSDGSPAFSPGSLAETSAEDHCACPHGWTGLLCGVEFQSCDGEHKCYNGGRCIPGLLDEFGNEQLFCDCTNAVGDAGKQYVGKYCEHPSTELCSSTDDNHFCVNGGICNTQYPQFGTPCECEEGFEGPHCEFEKGNVPDCDLDCGVDGKCVLGIRDPKDIYDIAHLFEEAEGVMHCDCPPGTSGSRCELFTEPCGEHECFNGGTCVSKEENDGEDYVHCDCAAAQTETTSYAGRFCQYASTSICFDGSNDSRVFCVNGGTCPSESFEPCSCPPDYFGPSCEFMREPLTTQNDTDGAADDDVVDDDGFEEIEDGSGAVSDDCSLTCQNGGTCQKGVKPHDPALDFIDGTNPFRQHNENYEHCVCVGDFVGLLCQHLLNRCPSGQHGCLNGGKCVADGDEEACDCSDASIGGSNHVAGVGCEHAATEVCTTGELEPFQPRSFCVNEGTCKAKIAPGQEHPGCNCVAGWTGPHCELEADDVDDDEIDVDDGGDVDGGTGAVSDDCKLTCQNGGTCQKGVKPHDPALDFIDGTNPFRQHNENYEHCVCVGDWVGLQCEHKLNRCPSGQHGCLNGGKCVADGDDEACDCNDASIDGSVHVAGVGCEHAATEICTTSEADFTRHGSFCVNDGKCKAKVAEGEDHPGCNCVDGWTGPHCELEDEIDVDDDEIDVGDNEIDVDDDEIDVDDDEIDVDDDEIDVDDVDDGSSVVGDDCKLTCQNGGTCQKGVKTHDPALDFIDGTNPFRPHNENYEHCVCVGDWVGLQCEHTLNRCPSGQHGCLNGGKCVPDGDDEACDCTDASINGSNHVAGVGCEHAATEVCTTEEPEPFQPRSFCVNGGTCKVKIAAGQEHPGCNCVGDWTGPHCELEADDVDDDDNVDDDDVGAVSDDCKLTCQNGGTCQKGVKPHDPALDFIDGTNPFRQHNENYEHCVCVGDWVGLQCEHLLNRCPSGQHGCLNGGKCVTDGDEEACDCGHASIDGSNNVAGVGCEHAATEVCTTGELEPFQPRSFCVNEGTCKAKIAPGQDHPGCDCVDGWTGPHCELSQAQIEENNKKSRGQIFLILLATAAVMTTVCCAYCQIRRHQRRAKELEAQVALMTNTKAYSDDPNLVAAPRYSDNPNSTRTSYSSNYSSGSDLPNLAVGEADGASVYIGPPRDEDGHALHSVDIL